jgi:SPX domain protein involved in polyphosphate accumulation
MDKVSVLERFASLNLMAVVKIVKKHDKLVRKYYLNNPALPIRSKKYIKKILKKKSRAPVSLPLCILKHTYTHTYTHAQFTRGGDAIGHEVC